MSDLRPSLDPAFDAFGVDVTIPSAPGVGTTVTVRAIPLSPRPRDTFGAEVLREDVRQVYAFRRAELRTAGITSLPRGTIIEAPEIEGGTVFSWKVDSLEYMDAEEFRAVLVR